MLPHLSTYEADDHATGRPPLSGRLPTITLHDLRHTRATLLLKAGIPVKLVSERLGHSNPSFTVTVYQHVLPGMQAEAAAKFAELLEQDGDRRATSTADQVVRRSPSARWTGHVRAG